MELFVYGDLMRGLPRHAELAGAEFVATARTAPRYALFAIDGDHAALSGAGGAGVAVAGELYRLAEPLCAEILSREPAPIYLGYVVLENGRAVESPMCWRGATEGYRDLSSLGCWRAYRLSK